ncbi:uncharacterized protein LOC134531168 [Bacillus rossius redtenbacheri]|uniref:uncharacterized protein LOC134531168 n=1 Tax=Bacillus rossius redtenbacheri TaxID=93214 RepID=UPI002FDE8E8F
MAAKWCVEHVECLIENYEKYPCLYNVKSPIYHNKHARNEALAAIASAVSELRPGTSVDEVKNKFAKLRSHFVAEFSKKKTSEKSGTGTDEIYEPNFWYYKKLFFLINHIVPRKGVETKLKVAPASRVWEPLVVYDEDQSLSEAPNESQDSTTSNQAISLSCQSRAHIAEGQPGPSAELCKTMEQPPVTGHTGTSASLDSVACTPKSHKKQKISTPSEDGYTAVLNSVVDELKKEPPRLTVNERFGQWLGCALDSIKDRGVCMAAKHDIMRIIMGAELDDSHTSNLLK